MHDLFVETRVCQQFKYHLTARFSNNFHMYEEIETRKPEVNYPSSSVNLQFDSKHAKGESCNYCLPECWKITMDLLGALLGTDTDEDVYISQDHPSISTISNTYTGDFPVYTNWKKPPQTGNERYKISWTMYGQPSCSLPPPMACLNLWSSDPVQKPSWNPAKGLDDGLQPSSLSTLPPQPERPRCHTFGPEASTEVKKPPNQFTGNSVGFRGRATWQGPSDDTIYENDSSSESSFYGHFYPNTHESPDVDATEQLLEESSRQKRHVKLLFKVNVFCLLLLLLAALTCGVIGRPGDGIRYLKCSMSRDYDKGGSPRNNPEDSLRDNIRQKAMADCEDQLIASLNEVKYRPARDFLTQFILHRLDLGEAGSCAAPNVT